MRSGADCGRLRPTTALCPPAPPRAGCALPGLRAIEAAPGPPPQERRDPARPPGRPSAGRSLVEAPSHRPLPQLQQPTADRCVRAVRFGQKLAGWIRGLAVRPKRTSYAREYQYKYLNNFAQLSLNFTSTARRSTLFQMIYHSTIHRSVFFTANDHDLWREDGLLFFFFLRAHSQTSFPEGRHWSSPTPPV
jgi:hypothetical protein